MSIDLTAANSAQSSGDSLSPDAQTHVVNRVSDDAPSAAAPDDAPVGDPEPADTATAAATDSSAATSDDAHSDAATPAEPKPALERVVKFLEGRMRINMYNEAVLGSPEAKYVVVELMDYTCPHCREVHKSIVKARDHYGDDLAVVVLPVPLEMECNKVVQQTDPLHRGACRMARIALAVAKLNPESFIDFHNWLLADEENPPSGLQILNRAWKLTDQLELSRLSNSDDIKKRIEKYGNLYLALSRKYSTAAKPFGLPVQIMGDTVLTGKFDSQEAMYEAWDKALGIAPATE
jgi:RNA binding exosome subunit